MYCSNDDTDDCTKSDSIVRIGQPSIKLKGWEELLYRYGVDVAIWAQEHSYERLWPIYNKQVFNGSYNEPYTNPKAPVHITTGSAGCHESHDRFKKKVSEWSAFRSLDYGYTRMKVYNQTHLYMEQVSDDKDGAIIDRVMLIKDSHGSYSEKPNPVTPMGDPLKKIWKNWQRVKAMAKDTQ
ncbi:unnamed protein product [Lymnaea stagnalis]|uniref:Purple acid phosphatase C-terminal domain-containing protein n=1 Tax=Lymnaea stagnalis TaxID=6523 RepID=A0AAV2HGP4_LYMST